MFYTGLYYYILYIKHIGIYLLYCYTDVSLLRLVAEALGQEYNEPDVPSESEAFADISLSGSCPPVDELVPLQLGEQGEEQCEYNTQCFIEHVCYVK